jgi:hypothetical protein
MQLVATVLASNLPPAVLKTSVHLGDTNHLVVEGPQQIKNAEQSEHGEDSEVPQFRLQLKTSVPVINSSVFDQASFAFASKA